MKKIIIMVYAAVSVITGMCALMLKEQVNICIDSLIPMAVLVIHIALGMLLIKDVIYFYGGKVRMLHNVDFKYRKDESGEGKIEVVDAYKTAHSSKERIAVGYTFLLCGAIAIPFIFFFTVGAKWVSIALFLIPTAIGSAIAIFLNFKELHDDMKMLGEENERHKKELEEQKKREEMGRWK